MLEKIELFRVASAMAAHAGQRQAVVAENIANADTPGYRARDVAAFADMIDAGGRGFGARASRSGHLHGGGTLPNPEILRARGETSNPNDNEVSLEDQMLKAVEVKRQHDKALAIYRSGLTILRSSLGRG